MKLNYFSTLICILFSSCVIGQTTEAFAQDTVYLSIPDAEQRFVNKNLTLLINKYNVDIAKASYLQAKLWYNPNLYYGTTLYNVETHKWLDDYYPTQNAYDQTLQLQQLLTLAGRHSATWKLAEVGVKQAQYQLADVLRSLKYQLYTDISDLYYNQHLVKMYQAEEEQVRHLVNITKDLYEHGNAAGNDVIQLQAQLQDIIAQEITCRQASYNDEQDLKILLVYPEKIYFQVKELPSVTGDIPTYLAIMDSAEKNRPDLLLSYAGCEYADKNLKLQRVTALPDLNVGATITGANAVTPQYTGIYASMDLPVFNRNQWNIAAAKYTKDQSELNDSLTLNTVKNQVTNAYCTFILVDKQLKMIDPQYENNLNEMMDNAIKNYDKRYINLLSLLSLINTYNDGKTNLYNLYVQYFNAKHNLNYTTGIDIIK